MVVLVTDCLCRVCDGGGGGDGTHDGDDHLLHDLHLLLGGCKVFLQTGVLSGTKLKLGDVCKFRINVNTLT